MYVIQRADELTFGLSSSISLSYTRVCKDLLCRDKDLIRAWSC